MNNSNFSYPYNTNLRHTRQYNSMLYDNICVDTVNNLPVGYVHELENSCNLLRTIKTFQGRNMSITC
jgi:hypothetical protein